MHIGTARSGQWCVTWAHAHEVLQSHGCTGWRFCRFSCATLPRGLVPPPLLIFNTACQCNRCQDAWCGGSWLSNGDCYSVQGLAGQLPVEALGHPCTQPTFCTLVINNINIIIVINGNFKWVSFLNEVSTPICKSVGINLEISD